MAVNSKEPLKTEDCHFSAVVKGLSSKISQHCEIIITRIIFVYKPVSLDLKKAR